MSEKHKIEKWVNIYPDDCDIRLSRENADDWAFPDRVACKKIVIEYEIGEGLEEKGMYSVGFIPARGGSQTLHMKNMAKLGGKPLIHYVCDVASNSMSLKAVYLSTDSLVIANYVRKHFPSIVILERPDHLRDGKSYKIEDVILFHKEDMIVEGYNGKPQHLTSDDTVVLLQPTSPFIRRTDISAVCNRLMWDRYARSAQTVCKIPHNAHAWNQRKLDGKYVEFNNWSVREKAFNKQLKPMLYTFGNVVATKVSALGMGMFATPSIHVEIDRMYAHDVDDGVDLEYAEMILERLENDS